jgi:hypothetical protein
MLMAIYLVEAGIVLIVAPWTPFWDQNYFATLAPWLREWLAGSMLRSAVTAIGLVTGVAGLREFSGAFAARRARLASMPTPPDPGNHLT